MEAGPKKPIEFTEHTGNNILEALKAAALQVSASIETILDGVEYNGHNPLLEQVTIHGKPVTFYLKSGENDVFVGKTTPGEIDFSGSLASSISTDGFVGANRQLVAQVLAAQGTVEVAKVDLGQFDAKGNRLKNLVVAA